MNKPNILTAILILAAGLAFGSDAVQTNATSTAADRRARKEAARLKQMKEEGGEVIKPGTMKGFILFGNAQSLVDAYELEEVRDYFWGSLNFKINLEKIDKVTPDTALEHLKKSGAGAAIYLVEDKNLPVLLVAPEDHWSIVNVSKLAEGAPTPKYTEMRIKKELVRAFVHTCGGVNSSRGQSMMGALRKVSDLDSIARIDLPLDVLMRFNTYMRRLGVTPAQRMQYIYALDEDWCPPPANEYQKRLWDERQKELKKEASSK